MPSFLVINEDFRENNEKINKNLNFYLKNDFYKSNLDNLKKKTLIKEIFKYLFLILTIFLSLLCYNVNYDEIDNFIKIDAINKLMKLKEFFIIELKDLLECHINVMLVETLHYFDCKVFDFKHNLKRKIDFVTKKVSESHNLLND